MHQLTDRLQRSTVNESELDVSESSSPLLRRTRGRPLHRAAVKHSKMTDPPPSRRGDPSASSYTVITSVPMALR